jgi:phytoene dehydrogenase-like protein
MEFDVIVVGGGISGGIPAAAYLQKAGAEVALIEGRHELGTFVPSHEVWPNVMSSPYAAGNWSGNSPAWEDLDLEDYGCRLIVPPVGIGNAYNTGKNLFLHQGLAKMCEAIARYSQKDAEQAEKIIPNVLGNVVELNELVYHSLPSPEKLDTIMERLAHMWGISADEFSAMNAFDLLEHTFESEEVRMLFLAVPAAGVLGDIGAPGQGAFSVPMFMATTNAQAVGGNHSLAHAMLRVFQAHGGTILRNCPVEKIVVEAGAAKAVRLSEKAIYPGEEVRARHAIVSNLGMLKTLEVVGEETLRAADPALADKMKNWDMASRASTATLWITKGFPNWESRSWDPIIDKAHFFYGVAWDSWEGVKKWYQAKKEGDTWAAFGRFMEIAIPAALDTSQMSPEGCVSVRAEEVLPFWWEGDGAGPEKWDDVKDEMLEKRTGFMDQLAPGFKEQVLDVVHITPLDIWRYNPAGIHGCGIGGAVTENQWMFDRMPYRMPVKGLYSSNSVWPVALTWMAPGYNAACAVAEDMGIRNQDWWTHCPVEWYRNNLKRLRVAP